MLISQRMHKDLKCALNGKSAVNMRTQKTQGLICTYISRMIHVRGSQKVIPSIFYCMLYTIFTQENFITCGHHQRRSYLQCCLHLCQQSFTTFEQLNLCPVSKSYSHLSTTTGSPASAVPHHSVIGVLAGSASKDQTGDNLMVLGQDCRMGLAVVSVQVL